MNNFAQENNLHCCLDLCGPALRKEITYAMLTHGCVYQAGTKLHRNIVYSMFLQEYNLQNVALIYFGQHCTKQLPAQCRQCWPIVDSLVNVFLIRLRQHCTIKLLVQCWPRAHRYTSAGKPAISNMSGGLFF